jgi:hypothetical protein
MEKILYKVKKYFERYEYGVYKEAKTENEKSAVWSVKPVEKVENYLKAMNANGRHIFIRPTFEREPYYMLIDDHDKKALDTFHNENGKWKPGRMVVETSPGNYQVWIKLDRALTNKEKSHWLKKMGSDPGASPKHRWGRAPGFRNKKEKYLTEEGHPLSKLVWVDYKDAAKIPKIKEQRIEQQEIPRIKASPKTNKDVKSFPTRADFERGDNNATDFAYVLSLMRRGVGREEVQTRILAERDNWDNHRTERQKQDYFKRTFDKAEAVIENSPATPRRGGRLGRVASTKKIVLSLSKSS